MKHAWIRRILILCAALALCFGMVLRSRREGETSRPAAGRLTLWYAESDCPKDVMDKLLARCRQQTGLWIDATAFPDEKALGEAAENAAPELLWCSHVRAGRLWEEGELGALAETVPGAEAARAIGEWVGVSFFPLGSRLPLLLVDTGRTDGQFKNLEALYAAGEGTPFLVSDDWAELLFTTLFTQGYTMRGDEKDRESYIWEDGYNALAGAFFHGGFATAEDPAVYVREGLVPCAITNSMRLAGIAGEKLQARLLPLPEGAPAQYPAELMGFAFFDGADPAAAESFGRWLCGSGEGDSQALAAGLVPLGVSAPGRTAVEKSIAALAGSGVLFCLPSDTVFYENRADCNRRLSAALDLLT